MRRRTALFAVLAVFAATFTAGGPVAAQTSGELSQRNGPERISGSIDGFDVRSLDDVVQVFIQFDELSVAQFTADTGANASAQKAQGAKVIAQQNRLRSDLSGFIVEERSNMVVGANGLRVMVRAGDIPAIRATDGVKSVAAVTRYHLTNATSVPSIGGEEVRNAGFRGDGVTIAVIDTGIDYTHLTFGGSGDPADYANNDKGIIEPNSFPTDKVVNGFDFAGPVYDASSDDPSLNTPQPDPDPLDGNGHGTHVSGSAAGLNPMGPIAAGMAPGADLLALKVFGDTAGSTDVVSEAIEFALDPNNDLSTDDAVDVINMSLGSDFGHPDDPSAISSQNAVDLGVVVVASAGNAGDVPYVTGSPAVANDVISVAASTDSGVTLLGMTVNSPPEIAGDYEAAAGDFGPLDPDTTGDLAVAEPLDACTPITSDVDGQIALIQRGTCEFTVKVRNAETAGAVGALVFNNADGPPISMAHNGSDPQPVIPAVMVGLADGQAIHDVAVDQTVNVTLSDDVEVPKPELADTMAGFTSRGPGFGNTFKPDVSAPGFSILSADVGTGDGETLNSGTSMASPHVAGAAAQLLEAHPDLTPAAVKALLMNSARPALPAGGVAIATQGTGVVQVDRAALDLEGYAAPAGLSFGYVNPTVGGIETETIEVTRLDGAEEATYDIELIPNQTLPGVTWGLSADTVTTADGAGSVDVSLTVDPAAMTADDGFFSQSESDGWVRFTNQANPDDTMVVGLLAVADPASAVAAIGGEDAVAVSNTGPADGFADGFTLIAEGDETTGSFDAIGYRTSPAEGYEVLEFGLALDEWAHPSSLEVDIFIDTNGDGEDDYILVAADLGLLSGADPTGEWVTALLTLGTGDLVLQYFAVADLNDGVAVLPVDLTGDFGFSPSETFDIDVAAFDQLGLAGLVEDLTVDLTTEITSADGLSLVVSAGDADEVVTEGSGDMLWLYANNALTGQHGVTTVTTAEEPPPPPPGEPPSFDDVPEGHLFHAAIIWLAEQGITRGCNPPTNSLFCPDDDVTRGQMAAFLNRALDLAATGEDFFVDDDGSVFENDINELAAAGITKGCNPPTNDQFCPDRTLSRAEMATFMVRGYGLTAGAGDDLFVDDDGNIHEIAIDMLGTAGITKGCNPPTNDEFCPDRTIIRGEMAAFLYRAFQATGLGGE